jgi:hypothetical protein
LSTDPQVVDAVDVRRDIPNNSELNKTMTVVMKADPGAATAINVNYVPLPDGSFTLSNNVILVGDEYRLTMQPGEFASLVKMTILNAAALDLTKTYAAGFTIYSADADGKVLEAQKSFVVVVSTKNKWDGVYRLYSGFFRSDQPGFLGVSLSPNGFYEPYNLITKGPNVVDATINTATYGVTNTQIIYNSGSGGFTYFTGVAPRLVIDNATNAVTVVPGTPAAPPAVNFTQSAAELTASKYYPTGISSVPTSAGKATIVAHFRWVGAGSIDRLAKDTFVYLRSR